MYDRPPVVALRDSLRMAAAAERAPLDADRQRDLCQRVYDVVDELKGAGWPPERVIVAVKQLAAEAGLEPTRGVLAASTLNEQDAVVVALVRWCVERYYGVQIARPT
jgi:hypothetical protein